MNLDLLFHLNADQMNGRKKRVEGKEKMLDLGLESKQEMNPRRGLCPKNKYT